MLDLWSSLLALRIRNPSCNLWSVANARLRGSTSLVGPRSPAVCSGLRVPRSGCVVHESLALTTNVPCQACHQRDPQRESRQQGRPWCSRVRRQSAQGERPGSAREVQNHHPHGLLVPGACAYRGCCWADWPVPQGPTASTKAAPPVALGFSGPRPCADGPASLSSCLVGQGWVCPHLWVAAPAL